MEMGTGVASRLPRLALLHFKDPAVAVLRVAVAAGGADAGLNDTSVATLFNLSGSSFDKQARYDGASLTLPSRLPWPNAKALVRALLDSLAASLVTPDGSALMRLLLVVPFKPLNAEAQAMMARLIATVEADAMARLAAKRRQLRDGRLPEGVDARVAQRPRVRAPAAEDLAQQRAHAVPSREPLCWHHESAPQRRCHDLLVHRDHTRCARARGERARGGEGVDFEDAAARVRNESLDKV